MGKFVNEISGGGFSLSEMGVVVVVWGVLPTGITPLLVRKGWICIFSLLKPAIGISGEKSHSTQG